MATKVRFKLIGLLWILNVVYLGVLVQCRPRNENSFTEKNSDPSDRTLIRVLRSEFEEDEKESSLKEKGKSVPKVKENVPRIKKRASEEDQFFQALLSRANDKPVEKRSYESQPEKDDVRMNWKGDSKISDADKHELEHLFNSISVVDDDDKSLKSKVDAKRATKTGVDGKVQDFVEWLMAKPPKEFHDSLRHLIDVEHQVSDIFYTAPADQSSTQTTSDAMTNDATTTTTGTTTDTTSPVTATSGQPTSGSVPPPVSITAGTTNYPQNNNGASGSQATYTTSQTQQAMPVASSTAAVAPSQQVSAQMQAPLSKTAKNSNLYADVMQASKTMAQTGPGPIPQEALDYFNKFTGGVESLSPQLLTNYGVHPQALPAASSASPVTQQASAVPQQAATVPQQAAASRYPTQYQQAAYGGQVQAGYPYQYQDQNGYYGQYNRQRAAAYPRPYRPRGTGYTPPPARPYPLNRDQLDKSTGKKKSVTASLLFKQNWSSNFNNKKSTQARVFKEEARKQLVRVFELKKNFKKIVIDKIREDRGKVSVTFKVVYTKETEKPLKPLYERIVRDYLGNMPVYRDTLFRGGLAGSGAKASAPAPSKMEQSQSDNPATEFAQFADQVDREMTGENLPLNEKHEAYQGCFKDKKPHRDMKKHFSKFEMTPEWCLRKCKKEGYRFAGVQYSYLCFCGNTYGRYGRVHDSECSSRCYGDKNRFCGSFWHNSVYSVDGQHHDPDEFSAVDDDEPDEDEGNKDESKKKVKKVSDEGDQKHHAEVANHLMKAASSALKAAKKLLPGKDKRQTEEEFTENKRDAEKALEAVDNIVKADKNVEKRSAEDRDGRNLLMAYLGNVGGYDREYRSAEDEEKPVEKLKFDYKRMIIDEEGDGEFVAKPHDESQLRRSRRSVETEEFDGRKKMALRAVGDGDDVTNPKTAVAEPSRRELLSKDSSDKEIKRRSRDTDDEEEEEEEEEMSRNKRSESRKRSVGFDRTLYHPKVQEGLESAIGGVIDVMKGTSNIDLFKGSIEKLATDVVNGLAIPEEQKEQVTREIRQDIKETGMARANSLAAAIRTELNEYGEVHPAVGPQADEAAKSISDMPLDESKAEEIKKKIRKRSLDETEEEDENKEKSFLSDILKEHSKHDS